MTIGSNNGSFASILRKWDIFASEVAGEFSLRPSQAHRTEVPGYSGLRGQFFKRIGEPGADASADN